MGAIYVDGICYSSGGGGGGGGASSADQVSLDDTNLAYAADDVQEAFEKVTKSLTYAEYEALTEEEKNNGTLYFITDANGDGQSFQPVIYSTEEREIGVWKDGKPLYEKTIDLGTLPNTSPNAVAHNIDNLGIVVYASGTAYNSTSQVSLPIPYVLGASSTYNIDINANSTNVTVTTYTDRSAFIGYIKLQYTKTTDTAGSGTWTPQGVPAHHYSTDEHVVGTWIDGSTLYEKTVVSTSVLTQGTINQIDLGITNVKDFVSVDGFASYGSNNSYIPLPYGDRSNSNICITTITKSGIANIYIGSDYTSPSTVNLVIITVRYTKSST